MIMMAAGCSFWTVLKVGDESASEREKAFGRDKGKAVLERKSTR